MIKSKGGVKDFSRLRVARAADRRVFPGMVSRRRRAPVVGLARAAARASDGVALADRDRGPVLAADREPGEAAAEAAVAAGLDERVRLRGEQRDQSGGGADAGLALAGAAGVLDLGGVEAGEPVADAGLLDGVAVDDEDGCEECG